MEPSSQEIKVRKKDLPKAVIGQTVKHGGTEYLVVSDGGFGFWSYWILRPAAAQSAVHPSVGEGFPTSASALAAVYSAPQLEPDPEPEIPASFTQAMRDVEEGKVFNLDDVLSEKPPPGTDAPEPAPEPPPREPEPFVPVVLESPDPPAPDAPASEPAAPAPDPPAADPPCFDTPTTDDSNVC